MLETLPKNRSSQPGEYSLEGQKLHALTSLRFFAALFVVVYHSFFAITPLTTSPQISQRLFSLGFLSVGFFFALSGYILGIVYLGGGRELQRSKFFVARIARIYPLYLVTMLSDSPVLLMNLHRQYGWGVIALRRFGVILVTNVLMLQAWIPSLRGLDNPNWSLSVEAMFYLCFPFLGAALWQLKGRWIWFAAASIWISNQIAVYFVASHVPLDVLKFNPLLHMSTFATGILLARWQTSGAKNARRFQGGPRQLIAALLVTTVAGMALIEFLPTIRFGNVHDGLLTPIFILVIWAFSMNGTFAVRWLSARWLVVLGEASFGLYLIHAVVLHVFHRVNPALITSAYPIYLVICIGLSLASFYWFETPVRRMIIAKMKQRSVETSEMAASA